jgi:anthranilate phosphoribosyltransferase
MNEAIARLVRGESLTEEQAAAAMDTIMRGQATPSQIAGFLVALRMKGETIAEIAGLARTARAFATPLALPGGLLDTCGTGGDLLGTFNISTAAAIVACACGARVAKHGNRGASSACGSADVLEALGIRIDLGPDGVARCIEEAGIGFMFAPLFHPSFKHVGPTRRELGMRTVFNVLGPLCNPAGASYQTVGVADAELVPLLAAVLARLGVERGLVFHAEDGMDELSSAAPSRVIEVTPSHRSEYQVDPADLGLQPARPEDLKGGDPTTNAALIRRVLAGQDGPRRDVVLLNTAAALRACGLAPDWEEGIALAAEAIDSGRAAKVLARWAAVSWEEPLPIAPGREPERLPKGVPVH